MHHREATKRQINIKEDAIGEIVTRGKLRWETTIRGNTIRGKGKRGDGIFLQYMQKIPLKFQFLQLFFYFLHLDGPSK